MMLNYPSVMHLSQRRISLFAALVVSIAVASSFPSVQAASKTQVTTKKFKSWNLECILKGEKQQKCHLAQKLIDTKGRKILHFKISKNNGGAYLEVGAPLGLYIPAGIAIKVDEQKATQMQLVDCKAQGCRAVLPLHGDAVKAFKKGSKLAVLFVDSKSGKTLMVNGSLNGFTAAANSFGIK
ncbi:MAG: invasion associated locus B family protein [Filomicrobium sp.]